MTEYHHYIKKENPWKYIPQLNQVDAVNMHLVLLAHTKLVFYKWESNKFIAKIQYLKVDPKLSIDDIL